MPARVLCFCIALGLFSATAHAHPSPKILQAGAAKGDRVAYTGISYSIENDVRMYRGQKKLLGAEMVDTSTPTVTVVNLIVNHARQKPARLRTQGFYSGASSSHPFTQGFYSDRK